MVINVFLEENYLTLEHLPTFGFISKKEELTGHFKAFCCCLVNYQVCLKTIPD